MKVYNLFFICFITLQIFSSEKRAEEFYDEGLNYYNEANFEASVIEFENAVNLDNDYFFIMTSNMMFERLLSVDSTNIAKEVEKICKHLIKTPINDSDPFVLYYLGWASLKLGMNSQAKSYLDASMKKMNSEGINSDLVKKLIDSIKT